MSFARRKTSEGNNLPKRTSSLRTSAIPSTRTRTPSATLKNITDKDHSDLDAIVETIPEKPSTISPQKAPNSPTGLPHRKPVTSISTTGRLPSATTAQSNANPGTNQSSGRETHTHPRPLSVTGIPSPSSSRSNSTARKDKYGSLKEDRHSLRRTISVRSVSASFDAKFNMESKPQSSRSSMSIPSRETSKPAGPATVQSRMTNGTSSTSTRDVSKSTAHSRKPSSEGPSSSQPLNTSPQTAQRLTKQQSTKEAPPSRSVNNASSQSTFKPLRSNSLSPNKPVPSKPTTSKLTTNAREVPKLQTLGLKPQRSKDFSPAPSSTPSSPKATYKPSIQQLRDTSPEQYRLVQLLHLIPLSEAALSTYESSAHQTLSVRYNTLQTRFLQGQQHDHAVTLMENLSILRSWSDTHIRVLSNIITDWESVTVDLRAFCRRLSTTLKPVNKSVLQEKDRLLSRIHAIEGTIMTLPACPVDKFPGTILEEVRENLPLLRNEMELHLNVAAVRWKSEVLQLEVKRMEVVNRMSLGKTGRDTSMGMVCVWRE